MNGYETKNSITRRRKSRKKAVIAVVAAILTLAILAVFLLSRETGVIDANGTPSRGLSFDKTSITSKTYTLVGIGACKDTDIIVPAEKDGMPVENIGEMAFRNNTQITGIVLPETLKTVGSSAFAYCENLRTVIFKGNITQINNSAFRYCESLEEITLPASVSVIAESAFSHCTNLTKIYYGGTMAEWDEINFGAYWNVYMPEYTVYCADGEIFVDLYSKYRG